MYGRGNCGPPNSLFSFMAVTDPQPSIVSILGILGIVHIDSLYLGRQLCQVMILITPGID